MGELKFIRPTGGYVSSVFSEDRRKKDKETGKIIHYLHKGLDYAATKGTPVVASESGEVIAVDTDIPGYGNLVIIDHAPRAKNSKRHIYSLYAHLDTIGVRLGGIVKKEQNIGTVGHSGYAYSTTGKDPSHLHFEVIDCHWKASRADILSKNGKAREYRQDPKKYLNEPTTIKGTLDDLTAEQLSIIRDSVDPRPVMDLERGVCRVDWYVGGIYKGTTDKDNKEIDLKLTSRDVEEILSRTPVASGREGQGYELEI